MKIRLNEDTEIVKTIREGLKHTGGYCPCRREKTEDTKCMCKEFKEQIANPNFEGFCHLKEINLNFHMKSRFISFLSHLQGVLFNFSFYSFPKSLTVTPIRLFFCVLNF